MISVSDLTLKYGKKVLFEHVSLKFKPGYCYGVIGANGAGKSTLLKILAGQIKPDEGEVAVDKGVQLGMLKQDQYAYENETVLNTVLMGKEKLYKIQKEKDALYAKPSLTEKEGHRAADLEAEFMDLDGYTVTAAAGELLEGLGVETAKHDWKMSQLAGGWKLRVLLAQILYAKPDVLLLDEPTNHLDIRSINWLEDHLSAYEGTLILVSHDRHFLNRICTHMVDIDRKTATFYTGNYDFFVMASSQSLDAKLTENSRKEKRISELKEFIARFSANASKSAQATSRAKLLEKIEIEEIAPSLRQYPRLRFQIKTPLGKDVVAVEELSRGYDGLEVLKNLSFTVKNGDRLAVIGPNGVGKTTLLKCLANGYEGPNEAGVRALGLKPDSGVARWGASVALSFMPQDVREELIQDLTMVDWLKQFAPMAEMQTIRALLGRMLFSGEQQEKKLQVLSGGECQRLLIAKMMQEGGNTLMLDEPSNHMDLESIEALGKSLAEFDGAVIFTSHDQDLISRAANRILELKPGGGFLDFKGGYAEYQEAIQSSAAGKRRQ